MFSARVNRRAAAFTLIELLVVVAIMSLLMAILMPSLGAARNRAVTLQCSSNARQIGMACNMYASENDNHWINYTDGTSRWPKALMNENLLVSKRVNIILCPADKEVPTNSAVLKWELGGGFGFNNDLNTSYAAGPSVTGKPWGKKITGVVMPSQWATHWDTNIPLVSSATIGWVFDRSTYATRTPDVSRHRGQGNVLFLDSHVESTQVSPTNLIKASMVKIDNMP